MPIKISQPLLLRIISVLIAISCGSFLSVRDFSLGIIVLGQGHFLLAYLYQAEGGRLPPRKIALLTAGFAFLLWAIFSLPLPVAGLLTAIGFLVHFALDEARLLSGTYSLYATLEGIPFVVLYSVLFSDSLFGTHHFGIAVLCMVPIVIAYIALALYRKRRPDSATFAFAGWLLLTFAAYGIHIFNPNINPIVWFWGIIIVHYTIWYGVYFVKLRREPILQREYVMRVVLVNALLIVCAYLWLEAGFSFFVVLFTPAMYYVWTFLHGLASFRGNELRDSFRVL